MGARRPASARLPRQSDNSLSDIVKALPGTAVFQSMKEMDEYLKSIQERVDDEEGS